MPPKTTTEKEKVWLLRNRINAQSEPIVCCKLGYLFNKEELVKALLEHKLTSHFSHIHGLKDVRNLKLVINPQYDPASLDYLSVPVFSCPVTKVEFNGLQPFVTIWSTGHVLSVRAVKELGIASLQAEYGPFVEKDLIRLLPDEEEVERLRAAHAVKKKAKKEEARSATTAAVCSAGDAAMSDKADKLAGKLGDFEVPRKRKKDGESDDKVAKKPSSSIAMTSSSTMKAISSSISEQEAQSKIYKGLFHADHEKDRKDKDLFMTVAGLRYTLG